MRARSSGKRDLEEHLNWHFRRNKREKEKAKKSVFRDWYLPISVGRTAQALRACDFDWRCAAVGPCDQHARGSR